MNAGAGFRRRDASVEDTQGSEEKGKLKAGQGCSKERLETQDRVALIFS